MAASTDGDTSNSTRGRSVYGPFLAAGIAFAVHLFVTILIVMFLESVVQRYVRFFDAHGTMLPVVTQRLIAISGVAAKYGNLLVLLFIVIDGPIALGIQFLPNRLQWLKVCWFDAYLLAAITFLFFSSVALCVPIQGMLNRVAGP